MDTILSCQNITKSYGTGHLATQVLHGVSLQVKAGEFLAIVGSSGSGKSTLLHVLGGLDSPDQGEVWLAQSAMHKAGANKRGQLRNEKLGFVYQFHHLLPEFNALENVAMPLLIAGIKIKHASKLAQEMLVTVGLEHRLTHKPSQMSGGERQRTAIARALIRQPACVLADEPTGNLDRSNAQQVMALLSDLQHRLQSSIVLVTHDQSLAACADRVINMDDGILVEA